MAARPSCCRTTPWVPLLCVVVMVTGIPLWYTFSSSAAESTRAALQSAPPEVQMDVVRGALSGFSLLRMVVLVLLLVALALLVLVALLDAAHRGKSLSAGGQGAGLCSLRSFAAFSAAGTALLWLAMLAVVLLLALCTAWFLGAWASAALLDKASEYSSTAEQAARRAVESAADLIKQVQATQLGVMDGAPPEVKGTQWYKDFRKGVQDIDTTILLGGGGGGPGGSPCAPGCISLEMLAGLAGLQDSCICLTNALTQMQQGLSATRRHMVPALAGLVLLYLAASWLLMYTSASVARASAGIRAHKAGKLRNSEGGGHLGGGGGGGYGGGAVDAAIDIHSGGGGGGGYGKPGAYGHGAAAAVAAGAAAAAGGGSGAHDRRRAAHAPGGAARDALPGRGRDQWGQQLLYDGDVYGARPSPPPPPPAPAASAPPVPPGGDFSAATHSHLFGSDRPALAPVADPDDAPGRIRPLAPLQQRRW